MKKKILLLFTLLSQIALAQNGTADNTFDSDGKLQMAVANGLYSPGGLPKSILVQPDGKILTCATVMNGANYDFTVFRFNADGSPDNSFDGDGKVFTNFTVNDYIFRIALQMDGKIVGVGYTVNAMGAWDIAVARYNSDGSPDNSFDSDGKQTTNINGGNEFALGLAIQTDGKIVVGGIDESTGGGNSVVLRYDVNGVLDITFDGDGIASILSFSTRDYIYDLKLQADGKIVCLSFNEYQTGPSLFRCIVSRFNTDGSPDNSLDGDGILIFGPLAFPFTDIRAYGFTIQADNKIVLVGYSFNGGSYSLFIARFNSNGTPDNGFASVGYRFIGNGLGLYLYDVVQQSNGTLVAAGSNGANSFYIHKFNSDGTDDLGFNGTGFNSFDLAIGASVEIAQAMCLQSDSKILAVGIVQNGGVYDLGIIRVNNSAILTPVTWKSFTVARKNNHHELKWVTATEQNNRGFDVQRSTDGKEYYSIGFVKGAGNSDNPKQYQYTDATPVKGLNYYRLMQIDYDDEAEYSVVRKINFDRLFTAIVYPNPLRDVLSIQLNNAAQEIKVLDMNGRIVLRREPGNVQFITLSLKHLLSGSYLLEILDSKGNRQVERILKL